MSISQVLDLFRFERKDEEVMSIIDIMNAPCEDGTNGICKRLVGIIDHINDYPNQIILSVDMELVKNFYEEEFWKHAPSQLKNIKLKLRDDPYNYRLMDEFSRLSKIYTYLIKFPWTELPRNPEDRKKENQRIIEYMSFKSAFDLD